MECYSVVDYPLILMLYTVPTQYNHCCT